MHISYVNEVAYMKKLVVAPISNTIYWETVNEKQGTMNTQTRVDVTDNAVDAVFQHFIKMNKFEEDGFFGYEVPRMDGKKEVVFCVFDTDEHITISKKLYEELKEHKAMSEGLNK